jgi:uncharacterized phiE125 gp8 family phage protein
MTFCNATTLHDYYQDRTTISRNKEIRHTIRIVTPPQSEPVTIQEAKAQLSIAASDDAHDLELSSFIAAAREEWERDTSTALINRTIEHRLPSFENVVKLTVRPAVSIESIKYIDNNGDEQTLDAANYYLDEDEVRFVSSFTKPSLEDRSEAVKIRYIAGYGEDSKFCPEMDRMAIKLSLANRFENRDMMVSNNYSRAAYESLVQKKMRASYP